MLEQRVVEWTEEWKREGERDGFRKGEASLLRRQLEYKFGALPAWTRDRLESATTEQLTGWGERLLTAPSLEEVFG